MGIGPIEGFDLLRLRVRVLDKDQCGGFEQFMKNIFLSERIVSQKEKDIKPIQPISQQMTDQFILRMTQMMWLNMATQLDDKGQLQGNEKLKERVKLLETQLGLILGSADARAQGRNDQSTLAEQDPGITACADGLPWGINSASSSRDEWQT